MDDASLSSRGRHRGTGGGGDGSGGHGSNGGPSRVNGCAGGSIKQSASLTALDLHVESVQGSSRTHSGNLGVGRLANSEMAARRLTFQLSRLQLLLGLSSKVCEP